jgi:hypothetical protein
MRITALVISLTLLSATTASAQVPRLEPVTRIGCVDCDGPTLFAGIQGLAVQGNRIYVLDTAAPYVRVFDSNGRVVRAFAREGSGPGELRLPIAVAPRAHGELEIFDMRLRRFTRFDSTGKSLGTRMPNGFTALVASAPGSAHVWLLQTDFTTPDQPVLKFSDNARNSSRASSRARPRSRQTRAAASRSVTASPSIAFAAMTRTGAVSVTSCATSRSSVRQPRNWRRSALACSAAPRALRR